MKKILLVLLLLLAAAPGCSKKEEPKQEAPGPKPIPQEVFVTTPSGLQYRDIVEGKGPTPERGDLLIVHFSGWLQDGTPFANSRLKGRPLGFRLGVNPMIDGWEEGLATMKAGGKRRLIVPPHLAYGSRASADGKIPPNATLSFELELVSILPGDEAEEPTEETGEITAEEAGKEEIPEMEEAPEEKPESTEEAEETQETPL